MRVYINIERCSAGVSGGAATLSQAVRRIVKELRIHWIKITLMKRLAYNLIGLTYYMATVIGLDQQTITSQRVPLQWRLAGDHRRIEKPYLVITSIG